MDLRDFGHRISSGSNGTMRDPPTGAVGDMQDFVSE
jgi:hypothetical protein